MKQSPIIAAVRDEESLKKACLSKARILFDLAPSIETLKKSVRLCQAHDKILFVHIDMAEGIGKDKAGLRYIKDAGAEGIISTRANLIKVAGEVGLKTVRRVFLIDSQSVKTTVEFLKIRPDMVEIMPGVVSERVIRQICAMAEVPAIAGGFIETKEEVMSALRAGVVAVSTSHAELWDL